MKQFFMTITEKDCEPGSVYATLADADLLPDGCQDLDQLIDKMAELGIVVPERMLLNVEEDSFATDGGSVQTYN